MLKELWFAGRSGPGIMAGDREPPRQQVVERRLAYWFLAMAIIYQSDQGSASCESEADGAVVFDEEDNRAL